MLNNNENFKMVVWLVDTLLESQEYERICVQTRLLQRKLIWNVCADVTDSNPINAWRKYGKATAM